MSFHTIKRVSAAVMALVSVFFCFFCGVKLYNSHRGLTALKHNQPAAFQADLTVEGKITTPLHFSFPFSDHGCFLYIKTSSSLTRATLAKLLKNTSIDLCIRENGRELHEISNVIITATEYPQRFLDRKSVV